MPAVRRVWWPLLAAMAGCAAPAESVRGPAAPAWLPTALAPFLGDFRGTLRSHGKDAVQEVPMRLEVTVIDGVTEQLRWVLHYGEGPTAQLRDYRLVIDDAAAGRYHVDERNGIELTARLCGSELVSVYAVTGPAMVVRYRALPDGIEFGLEAFDPTQGTATGQGVRSIGSFALQRAWLRRQVGG